MRVERFITKVAHASSICERRKSDSQCKSSTLFNEAWLKVIHDDCMDEILLSL